MNTRASSVTRLHLGDQLDVFGGLNDGNKESVRRSKATFNNLKKSSGGDGGVVNTLDVSFGEDTREENQLTGRFPTRDVNTSQESASIGDDNVSQIPIVVNKAAINNLSKGRMSMPFLTARPRVTLNNNKAHAMQIL